MTHFFAQFARNNTEVDRRTRREAVYKRLHKIVRCATYLLKDDARLWWEGASVSVNLQTLTWEYFKEVFYSKYFIDEDQKDIEIYKQGKRPLQAPQRQFQQPAKKLFQGPSKGKAHQPQKRANKNPTEYPVCLNCSRKHEGERIWSSGKLFKCGSSDHMLKNRPQWKQPTQGQGFVGYLYLKLTRMDVSYSVTFPSEEKLSTSSVVRELSLKLQGHIAYTDLIRWWLELVKYYDCDISYHPGKDSVVADALSRKAGVIAQLSVQRPLQLEMQKFDLEVFSRGRAPSLSTLTLQSTLIDRIRSGQSSDEQL
ncbi:uncharacterized protein [Primulina eburnea]|uniref:uncharacterized protein n=1 Tax=Primulina eburnea TaxID=1245227 RepID=UPI003C6CB537